MVIRTNLNVLSFEAVVLYFHLRPTKASLGFKTDLENIWSQENFHGSGKYRTNNLSINGMIRYLLY